MQSNRIPHETGRTNNEIIVSLVGTYLSVYEQNIGSNKFLLFIQEYSEPTFSYSEEVKMLEIIDFYMDRTEEENMSALILNYENLNNSVKADVESLGMVKHNHDELENYATETPELFDAHLPRGFYIYQVQK